MKKSAIIIAGILAWIILPTVSFAANDATEEFTPRSKKIFLEPEKSPLEKGAFKFLLATTAGYDGNVFLDSRKEGDAFAQTFFKASFMTPLSDATDGKIDYEMMNLLYAGESKLDLTRNGIRLGLDHKLSKDLQFATSYSLDSVEYMNTGADDYLDNSVSFKLTQQLPEKTFQSFAYDILFRFYDRRYTRTPLAASSDKERNDWRNSVTYEVGKYFKKDLVKFNLNYFYNDSNDPFMNYYDYDSFRLGGSVTHLFNNKISGILAYSRQYRDYRSRTLIADVNTKQHERTAVATAGLFYTLNKSLSFGLNYSFRQNHSNEPIDKYSGSIVSLSTYYKF